MTFLATLVVFATALSFIYLATRSTGRQHECSCNRSKRVLADYERIHNPARCNASTVLIPVSAITRKPGESVS